VDWRGGRRARPERWVTGGGGRRSVVGTGEREEDDDVPIMHSLYRATDRGLGLYFLTLLNGGLTKIASQLKQFVEK
jgi:hypothetical protein